MPLNDPIEQEIKVTGVEQAAENVDRVAGSTERLGESVDRSGDRADRAADQQRELTDAQRRLGNATDRAGDQADRAANQQRELADSTRGAGSGVRGLTGRLRGLVGAIGAAVAAGFSLISVINGIRDASREARQSQDELGESVRGLAANVGGGNADTIVRSSNEAALRESLGPEGRDSLIAAATTLTDLRGDLSPADLAERINQLATLRRATGVGGTPAVELLQSFESRLGLTGEDAVNQATGLLNAGLAPNVLTSIVERAGEVGGPELLDLLFAVRDQVNLASSGEAINSIVGALNRRDASGTLDPALAQLGITDDQSLVQRLGVIGSAFESGSINEGQFQQALGGTEGLRLGPALAREVAAGLDDDRAERLAITAVGQIQNILGSRFVRANESVNDEELRLQIAQENSRLAALNQAEQGFGTLFAEQGGGNAIVGFFAPGVALEPEERERQRARAEAIRVQSNLRQRGLLQDDSFGLGGFDLDLPETPAPGGTTIINNFNGPVVTNADPTTDFDFWESGGRY